jgi:hypothetical protein
LKLIDSVLVPVNKISLWESVALNLREEINVGLLRHINASVRQAFCGWHVRDM